MKTAVAMCLVAVCLRSCPLTALPMDAHHERYAIGQQCRRPAHSVHFIIDYCATVIDCKQHCPYAQRNFYRFCSAVLSG